MKIFIAILLLNSAFFSHASELNTDDWLLWHTQVTDLPYSSSLSIFPPVILYSVEGDLRGAIATPYSLGGGDNRLISNFLIVVIDNKGHSHFLKPEIDSVGFVNEIGIGMSALHSQDIADGSVIIQLYKANNQTNRNDLENRTKSNLEREKGITQTLAELAVPEPELDQIWNLNAYTTNKQDIDVIVRRSKWTIFQIYSEYCGFCRKAIPALNALHQNDNFSVIGVVGTTSNPSFEKHSKMNNINYPFISYLGKYMEPALLRAVGGLGFPTYLVVNDRKQLIGIYSGGPALDSWLNTLK